MNRILLVDDEASILKSLQRLLRAVPCVYGKRDFVLDGSLAPRHWPRLSSPATSLLIYLSATSGCPRWTASNSSKPHDNCSPTPQG